jgi:putative peptidoglycan lipid II flippase
MRVRARWQARVDWHDPALREVMILMIPRAIGLFLENVNVLIALNLASHLQSGSVAAYNRGWTLMQLPETLIGTAMGIVIFPTLAMLSASGDMRGKRAAMSGALRFILIASIPAAVALFIAGRPLVTLLEGGAFDAQSADRVFRVLQFFTLAIITQSTVEIVARSFYADKDTITPLWIALFTAALNFGLALLLVNVFNVAGLALANGLAVGCQMILLILVLRRRWHGIDEAALLWTTLKAIAASAAMAVALVLVGTVLAKVPFTAGRTGSIVAAVIQFGIGGLVYLAVGLLLRMEEIRALPRIMLHRQSTFTAASEPAVEPSGD